MGWRQLRTRLRMQRAVEVRSISCLCPCDVMLKHNLPRSEMPRMPASKEHLPAVGIDLGTTFSVICKLDEAGRPQTLHNAEGDKITPSVVFFEGENIVVGKEAVKALATEDRKSTRLNSSH